MNLETFGDDNKDNRTPWKWTAFKVTYWVQSAFILIDCVVLLVALVRIKRVLKTQPEFSANECYMTGHIAMLFFLLSSFVMLVVSTSSENYIVICGGIFVVLDFFVLCIMCAIMLLVNNDDVLTI